MKKVWLLFFISIIINVINGIYYFSLRLAEARAPVGVLCRAEGAIPLLFVGPFLLPTHMVLTCLHSIFAFERQ
jgi:hypothetical protein